ncbi:uncharacterized protein LOC117180123 [Belonocnema kinseyi]|uniref:uncharacterized protein LOC117180123 n=1 Tax=Belonocnema kinseyi TaxID=2817044 RepID=UPI00143DE5C7|nr:uncharacterized protein LOC117180123 [Belonocnema kinseyi]XP_033228358.1 uncharacterized protein LOC117180123 [Belonocnema kinseyi]
MFLVTLGCEEERFKVMGKKKLLKGRTERIEEDLRRQERRRKWLTAWGAWPERRKRSKVIIGRYVGVYKIKNGLNIRTGEMGGETGGETGGENGHVKVAFWNVSGLRNKDKRFSRELTKCDVIMMSEICADKKDWKLMKRILPKGYVWTMQEERNEHVKGRRVCEMVSGLRTKLAVKETEEGDRNEKNETMVRRSRDGKGKRAVVCVYRRRGQEED